MHRYMVPHDYVTRAFNRAAGARDQRASDRLGPDGAAPLLSAYALRLGLECGYGRHLGVVFCGLAADLFSTAVFVFEHGNFPYS